MRGRGQRGLIIASGARLYRGGLPAMMQIDAFGGTPGAGNVSEEAGVSRLPRLEIFLAGISLELAVEFCAGNRDG